MKHIFVALMLFRCFDTKAQAESLTPNAIGHLTDMVESFMKVHDIKAEKRKEEYILLFMEVDSNGSVSHINIMVDDKNKDYTYAAIKNILPADVSKWKSAKFKNKVIVIPISSLGSIDPATNSYLSERDYDPIFFPKECANGQRNPIYIFSERIYYIWPHSDDRSYCPVVENYLDRKNK